MKIAFFTDNYYPQLNGIATSVDYYAKNLKKQGHTVYLFAPKIRGYRDQQDYVYRLPSMRAFPSLPDYIRIPLPIPDKNFLKIYQLDFDLVHAHGNGIFSLIGLAVARAKGVPYVLTFHTQVDKFAHYFMQGKVVKGEHLNDILLRRFSNFCDGIITPSEKMRQELIASDVKKHIEVIPNFVELSKFDIPKSDYLHKMFNIPQSSQIILSVGRLGKEKNFQFLIKTFQRVTKISPNTHLILVGEGLEYQRLIKLGIKLGLENKFHMGGAIPTEDMPKSYADADMFVFPSTSEVHPMVIIEAAASGLPLIVAEDQAYEGLVINNKNGFVLSLNQEEFAEKIIKLIKNPALAKKMGQNSKALVKATLDSKLLINKLVRFYENTIKNYPPTV